MDKVIKQIAGFMAVSARTAPKARGVDNIVIKIVKGNDIAKLSKKMAILGKERKRPSFIRDSQNILEATAIMLLGTKTGPLGLDCGYCGYSTCVELSKTKGYCTYNSMDLGIAIGSAVSLASDFHVDNRIMYSIGYTAMKLGLLDKSVKIALGIPLSATGKNVFFDRK